MWQGWESQATGDVDRPIAPSPIVRYRKAHLKVAEILFDGTCANIVDADVVRHNLRAAPVRGSHCVKCYTLWLNLQDDPKHLFAKMSHTTRYEIRRAQREGLRYEFTSAPTMTDAERFFDFYDSFARSKNLKPSIIRRRVLGFLSQGVLDLSRVSSPDGRGLVWHAYVRNGQYACLLYSASLFRCENNNMATYIGRANRLHHWSDMLRFRDEGFAIYDLGGWYPGTEDQALLRINRFKESFGGKLVVRYNCDRGVTWKGSLGLWLARTMRIHKPRVDLITAFK
jgi:hypothetical protein